MHYFVTIISEATPILECSFENLETAKVFYENLLTVGYSLSSEDYEILFGSYSLEIEHETIIEKSIITKYEKNKLNIDIPKILLENRIHLN